MGFNQGIYNLLVVAAVGSLCEAQAPISFWPHGPTQNHQPIDFWKSAPSRAMFHPRALQPPEEPPTLQVPLHAFGTAQDAHKPVNLQTGQHLQDDVKDLSWRFPTVQGMPQNQPGHPEIKQFTPANSIAVKCGEKAVQVEVKRDFFGTGLKVDPSSITLGGCGLTDMDASAGVLIFQSALQGCNSVTMLSEEALVYVFSLIYSPSTIPGTPIVRSHSATVGIECHYSRKQNVSSNALQPTWRPYASTEVDEELLAFSLRLMTDDWNLERPSNVYFLGEFMHMEASVIQLNHAPLRVFVDNCVAATDPNMNQDPRYTFIENHGCFTDGKISNSSFLPRKREDKLQLQLEVFQFQQHSGSIYITCLLRATAASTAINEEQKACSFTGDGWTSADRNNQLCSCCNTKCGHRKARDLAKDEGLQWEGRAIIGPIFVKER